MSRKLVISLICCLFAACAIIETPHESLSNQAELESIEMKKVFIIDHDASSPLHYPPISGTTLEFKIVDEDSNPYQFQTVKWSIKEGKGLLLYQETQSDEMGVVKNHIQSDFIEGNIVLELVFTNDQTEEITLTFGKPVLKILPESYPRPEYKLCNEYGRVWDKPVVFELKAGNVPLENIEIEFTSEGLVFLDGTNETRGGFGLVFNFSTYKAVTDKGGKIYVKVKGGSYNTNRVNRTIDANIKVAGLKYSFPFKLTKSFYVQTRSDFNQYHNGGVIDIRFTAYSTCDLPLANKVFYVKHAYSVGSCSYDVATTSNSVNYTLPASDKSGNVTWSRKDKVHNGRVLFNRYVVLDHPSSSKALLTYTLTTTGCKK